MEAGFGCVGDDALDVFEVGLEGLEFVVLELERVVLVGR